MDNYIKINTISEGLYTVYNINMGTVQNYQKIAIGLQADPQVHLLPKNV